MDVEYHGTRIRIDLDEVDQLIAPDVPTFSGIREMYARDVYLKFFDFSRLRFQTVVDAGGNRGLFSIFAAALGARVAWVEPLPKYVPAVSLLVRNNQPEGRIHTFSGTLAGVGEWQPGEPAKKLGIGGACPKFAVNEIIVRCDLPSISFFKMDVEGAEFHILRTSEAWIGSVANLALEVHPDWGDPCELADYLLGKGFEIVAADADLTPTPPAQARYLYASRTGALRKGRIALAERQIPAGAAPSRQA